MYLARMSSWAHRLHFASPQLLLFLSISDFAILNQLCNARQSVLTERFSCFLPDRRFMLGLLLKLTSMTPVDSAFVWLFDCVSEWQSNGKFESMHDGQVCDIWSWLTAVWCNAGCGFSKMRTGDALPCEKSHGTIFPAFSISSKQQQRSQ